MNLNDARVNMIKQQFRTWGIVNPAILDLFEKLLREQFVPKRYEHLAYADTQIPLGHDQTMLTPREEAKILDVLNIQPNERVLEIGTGSGFFTALLSKQAKHVDSVDIFEDFIDAASQKLNSHNIHNVMLQVGDAAMGYKKNNHYDVIVITGSLPVLPKNFLAQLNLKGRLFVILGKAPVMQATLITHTSQENFQTGILFETYVSRLRNAHTVSEFTF